MTGSGIPPARVLCDVLRANLSDGAGFEFLCERRHNGVGRLHLADGRTVVVKLWARPGLRGWFRRLTHTGNASREWWALRRLHARGLRVPAPLTRLRFTDGPRGFTDGIVCEDLGDCTRANLHLEEIVAREGPRDEFDQQIVAMTEAVLDAGVLDEDHHLNNLLFTPGGSLVRIDLELARHVRSLRAQARMGRMLSNLICSYLFAVQPRTEMATVFSQRLVERVRPSMKSLRYARAYIAGRLDEQRRVHGIETVWVPTW